MIQVQIDITCTDGKMFIKTRSLGKKENNSDEQRMADAILKSVKLLLTSVFGQKEIE